MAVMAVHAWFLQVYMFHLPPSDFIYCITFPHSSLMLLISCLQISNQTFQKPFSILQTHLGFHSLRHLLLSTSSVPAKVGSASGKQFNAGQVFFLKVVLLEDPVRKLGPAGLFKLRHLLKESQLSRMLQSQWSHPYQNFKAPRLATSQRVFIASL